jgi:hypothetical protein
MKWQPIETAPTGIPVLIHYQNRLGNSRVIKARYIQRFTEECCGDAEEGAEEYDEANDCYTYIEEWWKCIDNWDDFAFIGVHEGVPDAWMP